MMNSNAQIVTSYNKKLMTSKFIILNLKNSGPKFIKYSKMSYKNYKNVTYLILINRNNNYKIRYQICKNNKKFRT